MVVQLSVSPNLSTHDGIWFLIVSPNTIDREHQSWVHLSWLLRSTQSRTERRVECKHYTSSAWLKWRFSPARRYASAGNSDRNVSVRPSAGLSVTRRYCVKMKKASGMISSPSGSSKTLVFWRQISSPNSKGFPRTRASNKGRSEKFSDFLD